MLALLHAPAMCFIIWPSITLTMPLKYRFELVVVLQLL
jgi:hypothetical protein